MAKNKGSRSHSAHLPDKKNAPKRTGKAGIKPPLDAKEDFDQPTRKDAAAGAEVEARGDQPELLETPKEKKPVVVKDRFEVSYLKPIFSKMPKTGDKLISLQMSLALNEEHKVPGIMPKMIAEAWKFIAKHGRKQITLVDVPGQNVRIYLTSDDKEEQIGMPVVKMVNVSLAVIQKKGEGEALKVIRLQFRIQVPFSREVAKFAESNYGSKFWIEMHQTQEELFDEEGDET